MDQKEKNALEALSYIKSNSIIGLGGGGTIAYMAKHIAQQKLSVKVVTPSYETEALCVALGLTLLPLRAVSHVDQAFDGCDEVDSHFYALKSGGGIHTREKLIANMADQYMVIVPEDKFSEELRYHCPIAVELLEDAEAYVKRKVEELGGSFACRHSEGKYGAMMSDHGNVLADVRFPHVEDSKQLNHALKQIAGVIDTSLLTREVTQILIGKKDGFTLLEKGT